MKSSVPVVQCSNCIIIMGNEMYQFIVPVAILKFIIASLVYNYYKAKTL